MSSQPITETALAFPCEGERLLGVVSAREGAPGTGDLGVVIVVGGPQVRAGSHRQFVQLARHLAAQGLPALRFDVRGMGDSSGPQLAFEHLAADIGAAIAALQQARPEVRRVALWGLCDAASAALLYLHERPDPRVAALCLANPWVRSEASLARTQVKHYYRQRLMQREFWLKLLRGGVAGAAWRDFIGSLRAARPAAPAAQDSYQVRMAQAWRAFDRPILLLLSGDDYTAREFADVATSDPAWRGALAQPGVTRHDLRDADHTFSSPKAQREVEALTRGWLQERSGRPAGNVTHQPYGALAGQVTLTR